MNKTHFYIGGDWVDAINTDDEEQIAQRRQEVAERHGVEVEAVQVADIEQVRYNT